jgi:hypothetical protein
MLHVIRCAMVKDLDPQNGYERQFFTFTTYVNGLGYLISCLVGMSRLLMGLFLTYVTYTRLPRLG